VHIDRRAISDHTVARQLQFPSGVVPYFRLFQFTTLAVPAGVLLFYRRTRERSTPEETGPMASLKRLLNSEELDEESLRYGRQRVVFHPQPEANYGSR
jgi:hypothetical protein